MPRLWNETIDAHKRAVDEAILGATAALVQSGGLGSVTMSGVAAAAGIGRATLYKYYPSVKAVLRAWHERVVGQHLAHLREVRDGPGDPLARLEAVLEGFALSARAHPGVDVAAALHRGTHVARAHEELRTLLEDLLLEGVKSGDVRADVAPGELVLYCLHALGAACHLPSEAAVRTLVTVTISGLRQGR
jgi:AcrR family transcriptional regulator